MIISACNDNTDINIRNDNYSINSDNSDYSSYDNNYLINKANNDNAIARTNKFSLINTNLSVLSFRISLHYNNLSRNAGKPMSLCRNVIFYPLHCSPRFWSIMFSFVLSQSVL